MNRRVKRTLCTGLAALMLAGCMTGTTVYAETAKEKVDRLEAALKQEKASLAKLQKDKKNAETTKTKLQNQSALLKEQLAALLETITDAEEAVGNKENEIAQKQAEIDSRWDEFKQQMGAMQMMHDTGAVAMLASCDNLYELLTFSNTMQEVSEWNTQVLDEMKAQRETLNEERPSWRPPRKSWKAARPSWKPSPASWRPTFRPPMPPSPRPRRTPRPSRKW